MTQLAPKKCTNNPSKSKKKRSKSTKKKAKSEKSKPDRGRIIRLSGKVIALLGDKRKAKGTGRGIESIDSVLRRVFGLSSRSGKSQSVLYYWVLTCPELSIFTNRAIARGESCLRAVRAGRTKNTEKPIKVRQVI